MDPSKFDDLTKAMATSTSRRQALKTIAATTLGGILGLGGIGTVFAKSTCKPNGHGCGNNKQCCSGFCDQTTSTCACPPGTTQLNGTCCPTAQVCNGVCCPSGQNCQNGFCVPPGSNQLQCFCADDFAPPAFKCVNTCDLSLCNAQCAAAGHPGNAGEDCSFNVC